MSISLKAHAHIKYCATSGGKIGVTQRTKWDFFIIHLWGECEDALMWFLTHLLLTTWDIGIANRLEKCFKVSSIQSA